MLNSLKKKKIVFFGTPDFTTRFLDLFENLGLEIPYIITSEDKPFGRGMQMKSPAPKIWANSKRQFETKVLQPKKLDENFYNFLTEENKTLGFDLFIVIAYGKILPENIINLAKFGTINLHYSLLPKYRGASPVETAILNEEKTTGITIQQMVYALDAGDILEKEEVGIGENDTASTLREKLNGKALEIFPKFLKELFGGENILKIKQKEEDATYSRKFSKADLDVTKEIDQKDLKTIFLKFKAFDKKIYFFKNNKRIKITEMNNLEILKLLPESKKEITLKDFENSYGKIFSN